MARLWTLILAAVLVAVHAAGALAQDNAAAPADAAAAQIDDAWPTMPEPFARGPGFYLSWVKLLVSWLLFLLWVKTTDWVSQDCQRVKQNYAIWNPTVFFPFVLSYLLLWMLPWFWLGFLLMFVAWAAPLGTYIWIRNHAVLPHQRVLTPSHLRHVFSQLTSGKISSEKQDKGPPVKFFAKGAADDQKNQANLILARQSPGFLAARELIADMVDRRADGAMLDYTADGMAIRYQVDGVWHNGEPRGRETGDPLLAVLKTISALNPADRRTKQEGKFEADYNGVVRVARLVSQGVEGGERALVQLEEKKLKIKSLDELNMRAKMQEQLKEALAAPNGFVLISALPGGGLTTTTDSVLKASDRYIRDFTAIEDERRREHEVENIQVATYNGAAGESPATILPKVIRTYPNVLVVRDLVNAETVKILCEEARGERLVIGTIRAKECVEALLRVLMMKVPAKEFAPAVTAVLCQRMIRKLCEKCKKPYPPSPELLKQLGLPEGRVEAFYRPPTGEEAKKPCPECAGTGYYGRTAMFELLMVNDAVRQALIATPKLDVLRGAARKAGMRLLQEEGIVLVVKGTTSLQELQRALKGGA